MKERLQTFLFRIQGTSCAAGSAGQLGSLSAAPLATLSDGPWHLFRDDSQVWVIGTSHWGHPLRCSPMPPHVWPQPADPSLGCALEDGMYLLHSSPVGHALPIAEKATVQQKGFVWSRPQGKPTHRVGLSSFVSRLKTWPSPPLSPKRPS